MIFVMRVISLKQSVCLLCSGVRPASSDAHASLPISPLLFGDRQLQEESAETLMYPELK